MKEKEIVFLTITSWVGFLGLHYYGSLWNLGKRRDLEWVPSEDYRNRLNRCEDDKFSKLKKNQKTIKFLREHDLIEEAIKQYRIIYPKGKHLLKGNPAEFGGMYLPVLDTRK